MPERRLSHYRPKTRIEDPEAVPDINASLLNEDVAKLTIRKAVMFPQILDRPVVDLREHKPAENRHGYIKD